MKSAWARNQRRSIRLAGYDYSQSGAYFVTVCARNQQCIFGEIEAGEMKLNKLARIVEKTWTDLPEHYLHVLVDIFVVMPNHVHGVILLTDDEIPRARTGATQTTGQGSKPTVGAGFKPAPTKPKRHALPEIVRAFKTFSSRQINLFRGTVGTRVWQRGYYDRVIRTEAEFNRIKNYILGNPHEWMTDSENPFAEAPHPGARDLEI